MPAGLLLREMPSPGVACIAFSSDGRTLAAAGTAPRFELWDPAEGTLRSAPDLPQGGITAMALDPKDRFLAMTVGCGAIVRWDLVNHRLRRPVTLREDDQYANLYPPVAAAMSPDCSMIAVSRTSMGWERGCATPFLSVRIWETSRGKLRDSLAETPPVDILTFSPDSRQLAIGCSLRSETSLFARICDLSTRKFRAVPCPASLHAMSFSPDGSLLACGGSQFGNDDSAGEIIISEVSTGSSRANLQGNYGTVTTLSFSPDGAQLASGHHDGAITLWNRAD